MPPARGWLHRGPESTGKGVAGMGRMGKTVGGGMAKRAILAAAVSVLLVPGIARASGGEALVWEETRQEIPSGAEISLWEQLDVQGGQVPQCQAEEPATLVTNGQSSDSVSGPASPSWSECGAFSVTGGFTSVEFDPQKVVATAVPAISITEPSGCVYNVSKVEGTVTQGLEQQAAWQIAATGTLSHGTPCSAELHLEGVIELFPRSAGSPLPWRSLEAIEKEKSEKESKEKAAQEEKERAAREQQERTRKATEEAEEAQIQTGLYKMLFPSGKAAKLATLLKKGSWRVSYRAASAGTLTIAWYHVTSGAFLGPKGNLLVARGTVEYGQTGTKTLIVKLTKKGSQLLKTQKGIKLVGDATFAREAKPTVTALKWVVLKR